MTAPALRDAPLLDHLVGDGEQRRWNFEAERLGSFRVDHQFKLGGAHNRKLGRPGSFQDAAGVDADLTKTFRNA